MNTDLIATFTPETFGEWCREQFDRFTSDLHPVSDSGGFARAEIVGYVQSLPDADINRPLLVMAVHAGSQINERTSRRLQFDFARRQLQAAMDRPPSKVKGLFSQGLFAFYDDEGNCRLSLITGRAEGRKLVYSDFKRQSFFVAPDRENKTFRARMASQFSTWQSLVDAFSVETLTKEFYNSLFAWYERAMDPASKVSFPNDVERDDDNRLLLSEHLIRLITRLMFVWFIRQKKLVPKELFDTGDLRQILTRFDPLSPKQDNYYRAILQNLFFATLNCEIGEREFAREGSFQANKEHFGIKLLYRYRDEFACPPDKVIELFRTVPFLNGGLFECLDKQTDYQDGFSRNPKRRAHIPNSLFFDEEGLITLFSRYDFTVDENSPNDTDVALDPELLGKVFENLLGAYNPETRQTARKQSGSFYTPREIVNYMVDESLVAHLRTKVPEAEEPAIRTLLSEEDTPALAAPLRRELVEALYHCRILDPACGSGAFPMGVLLKMVHLLQRLDEKNALWREIVLAEADKALAAAENLDSDEKIDRRRRITESFDQNVNEPDYARKLYLIENCIFGVDIQSIAVQIAKLRTFITLVCDQRPNADPTKNYGMLPLPNLETKFVAANTLIGLEADFADGLETADGASLLNDPELHRQRADLAEVRHRHFRARNAPEKNKCRAQDEKLRGKIRARLVEIASKPNAEKIALWQVEIGKLQQQRRAVEKEDWREVVRSTPMQGSLFETAPKPVQTTLRIDVNKERRERIDDDIRRFTRDIETEQNRAKNKSAFQHEADRLAAWDPYDQNASSPFFDPEWMFDVKDGFDIVLGNPPYVSALEFSRMYGDEMRAFLNAHYKTARGAYDYFVLFIERGLMFCVTNGHLCFITPNKYLAANYAVGLREWLLEEASLLQILDVSPIRVFDVAAVYPVVSLFCKDRGAMPSVLSYLPASRSLERFDTECYVRTSVPAAWLRMLPENIWGFLLSRHASMLPHVMKSADSLSTFGEVNATSTAGEAEEYGNKLDTKRGRDGLKVINTGTIDRYVALWGCTDLTHGGRRFRTPYLPLKRAGVSDRRVAMYKAPKVVFAKMAKTCEAFLDVRGEYASLNTNCFYAPRTGDSLLYVGGVCNSRMFMFLYDLLFGALRMSGGYYQFQAPQLRVVPIPRAEPADQERVASIVSRILSAKSSDPAADTSAMEREIDGIVYRLYGLTADEIAIVEGREPGAKKVQSATKPAKAAANAKKPRKSVLTEDPDLA